MQKITARKIFSKIVRELNLQFPDEDAALQNLKTIEDSDGQDAPTNRTWSRLTIRFGRRGVKDAVNRKVTAGVVFFDLFVVPGMGAADAECLTELVEEALDDLTFEDDELTTSGATSGFIGREKAFDHHQVQVPFNLRKQLKSANIDLDLTV